MTSYFAETAWLPHGWAPNVQITVDEAGKVIDVKLLSGLGYGLDEEAIKAAKAIVFTPASRCGRAIVGTVTLPFRFELS